MSKSFLDEFATSRVLLTGLLAFFVFASVGLGIAVASEDVTTSLSPEVTETEVDETVTVDIVVEDVNDDIGAYETTIGVDDPNIAEISNLEPAGDPLFEPTDPVDNDGSSGTLDIVYGDDELNADSDGTVVIATATLQTAEQGTVSVNHTIDAIGDSDGESFQVTGTEGADITVDSDEGDAPSPETMIQHADGGLQTDDGTTTALLGIEPSNKRGMEFGSTDQTLNITHPDSNSALLITPKSDDPVEFERLRLSLPSADGKLKNDGDFTVSPVGEDDIPVTVEGDEDIFADRENTFNDYEITLLENGEVIDSTDERTIGIAYEGQIEQDSTEDEVTFTLPRDGEIEENWLVNFDIFDELVTEVEHTDDDDLFETTVDVSELDSGTYSGQLTIWGDDTHDDLRLISIRTDDILIGETPTPELSNLKISNETPPVTLAEGDNEPISVDVENTGDEANRFFIDLETDGVSESQGIDVGAGDTETIVFDQVTGNLDAQNDAYTVSVQDSEASTDSLSGELTVEQKDIGDYDISIDHNPGSSTSSTPVDEGRAYADQLDIFVETDDPAEFGGDTGKQLRIINPETDRAVTYTPTDDARTVPLDEMYRLGFQNDGTGEPREEILPFPDSDSSLNHSNIDVTVEGHTNIFSEETFNEYVIELLNEDGEVLDNTDERLVGMGYEATFDQDEEVATIPRDPAVEEDWTVRFRVTGDDPNLPPREEILDEIEIEHSNSDDTFEVPIDELDIEPGEYRWDLVIIDEERADVDRERIVRISGSPDTDSGVTIPEPVTINSLELEQADEKVNDEVTVTANVEDAAEVDLGLSADFTSFTTTVDATEGETDHYEATVDISEVNSVGDGEFNPYIVATDEVGNDVTETNTNQTVMVDTSTPEIQPRVSGLGEDDATLRIEADEDVTIKDIDIEAEAEADTTEDRSPSTPSEFGQEFNIEFDGTSISEQDTTFSISVVAEDEAGNEDSYTLSSSITGYELENAEATVDPDSADGSFDLSAAETADEEVDRTAIVGQTSTAPAGTAVESNQIAEQFIDVTDIGLDETELEDATVRVPLEKIDLETFEEDDLVFFYSPDDEKDYEVLNPEIEDNELVVEIDGFSQIAPGGLDDQPPSIDDTTINPGTELEASDESVTLTIEYSPVISDINVSAIAVDVDIDEDRINVQTTDDQTEITIDSLQSGEDFDVELTVVDDAANEAVVTESISVAEQETTPPGGNGDNGGGGGGAGGGGAGGGGGSGLPSIDPADVNPPSGAEVEIQAEGTIRAGEDESVVGFGSYLENPVAEQARFNRADIDGEARTRDYDGVTDEIEAPPGNVVSVSEILIPPEFQDESARLIFNIENAHHSELSSENLDTTDLTVWRHTGDEWEALETSAIDNSYIEAETPGFSYFAITDEDTLPDTTGEDSTDTEEDIDDSVPGFNLLKGMMALIILISLIHYRKDN